MKLFIEKIMSVLFFSMSPRLMLFPRVAMITLILTIPLHRRNWRLFLRAIANGLKKSNAEWMRKLWNKTRNGAFLRSTYYAYSAYKDTVEKREEKNVVDFLNFNLHQGYSLEKGLTMITLAIIFARVFFFFLCMYVCIFVYHLTSLEELEKQQRERELLLQKRQEEMSRIRAEQVHLSPINTKSVYLIVIAKSYGFETNS